MRTSDPLSDALTARRIALLKEKITLRQVMEHFGHRPRAHGNMICCWHSETNPSAKFYEDQNTYWCWVCSPRVGVDQVEFARIELFGDADNYAAGLTRAISYLETEFGVAYLTTPWEKRLYTTLRRPPPKENATAYWRSQHLALLRTLSTRTDPARWATYAALAAELARFHDQPVATQRKAWELAQQRLSKLS